MSPQAGDKFFNPLEDGASNGVASQVDGATITIGGTEGRDGGGD